MKPEKTVQDYFTDEQTYVTPLMAILFDEYGGDFLEWDPATLALEIKDDFKVELTQSVQDKIQSGVTLLATNAFFANFEGFTAICNALSFDLVDSEMFMPPTLEEVSWAIIEAQLLLGKEEFENNPFIEDIARFTGFLLSEEGIYMPPAFLKFAIYPDGVLENTAGAFTNDPLMFDVYTEKQNRLKDELELYVQTRLMALLIQLRQLPLKDIDKKIVERMLAGVAASIQSLDLPINRETAQD